MSSLITSILADGQFNGIHLMMFGIGLSVGIAIGYIYGWLHYSDVEKNDYTCPERRITNE